MTSIYRWVLCVAIFLAVGLGASGLLSQAAPKASSQRNPNEAARSAQPSNASSSEVDRGKYIVENVAMCEECHTPRDSAGNLDESRRLQGAPIWITPVHRTTNWSMRAPALAGFGEFTQQQGEDILERGVGPNGLPIQPPMHIYHMNHADADAVIAYLRSLPGGYPVEQ
jgi:hypothetical protein